MDNTIRPLRKSHYLIVHLDIVDEHGNLIEKPYVLREGANVFKCIATYVDGSTSHYEPYWTCPIMYRTGDIDLWRVLGKRRMASVAIHASVQQERYTELACWVFAPGGGISEIILDSTSFDYSLIS